ncbi:MAG: hypothetical protein NZ583_08230 [Desulfobacterota bacterium]|nr:hypothetical protein [Thermodesulfobacteriota bacterium]
MTLLPFRIPVLLILSISSLLILFLYVLSFSFRFYTHPFLNLLTHGVSGGKMYFFLAYASISLFIAHLTLNMGKRSNKPEKETEPKERFLRNHSIMKRPFIRKNLPLPTKKTLFFISLSAGMLSSIGSYLWYVIKFDLSLSAYHYHFRDTANSVNSLLHIHTSKLFIYTLSEVFGIDQSLSGMDTGSVFKDVIPLVFPLSTSLCFFLCLFLSLFLIRDTVLRWNERERVGISVLSVLCFFSVIKAMADGGPLAYDFLVGVPFIYLILSSDSYEGMVHLLRKSWRILFWAYFLLLSLIAFLDPSLGMLSYTLQNVTRTLSLFLFVLFLTVRHKTTRPTFLIGITLSSSVLALAISNSFKTSIKPFLSPVGSYAVIHYFDFQRDSSFTDTDQLKDRALPYCLTQKEPVYTSPFVDVFRIYPKAIYPKAEETPLEIYRRFNENPLRNRHLAILEGEKRTCGLVLRIRFVRTDTQEVHLDTLPILHLGAVRDTKDPDAFFLTLKFNPQIFPFLAHSEKRDINQLDENHKWIMYLFLNHYLYHSGVREFIMTPMAFFCGE